MSIKFTKKWVDLAVGWVEIVNRIPVALFAFVFCFQAVTFLYMGITAGWQLGWIGPAIFVLGVLWFAFGLHLFDVSRKLRERA